MKRTRAEAAIVRLLRRTALRGSDRAVAMDRPIGSGGLGLDSLALAEFVVALEKRFGVEVPDEVWSRLPEITPAWFARLLVERGDAPVGDAPVPDAGRRPPS